MERKAVLFLWLNWRILENPYRDLRDARTDGLIGYSKGTPTYPESRIPQASPKKTQMKGIPNHKLLVGGRFGMFQGNVGKFLEIYMTFIYISCIDILQFPFFFALLFLARKWQV